MASYIPGLTDFIPDIQPFQPDWGTVDKTLRMKQGTYDQNYASLQGTYSGLLNMPQLKQDQIDKRDKFLQQAFKNLGDLTSVDLSLPENISAANNVFAPLYKDGDFLGNSAISKHYDKQEQIADSLRLKDGGKEYSQDNLNYVRLQKMDYINDTSPDAWKKYYSSKRSYEPYYDTKKEIREAMEKFKPSSSSYVRLNGMYKVKTDDASWRESEIKDYLGGILSDKAKRQLQIEATVRLGNPNTIATMYRENAQKDIAQYNDKVNDLDKLIANTKDPVQKDKYIDLKNQVISRIADTQEDLDKVQNGDSEFIKANQEKLAYGMYYNNVIGAASKGFAHTDIKQDIDVDQVAFGMWKDAQETRRLNIREAGEDRRLSIREAGENNRMMFKYKYESSQTTKTEKDKNGSALSYSIAAGPGDVVSPDSLGDIDNKVAAVKADGYKDSEALKEHIADVLGTSKNKVTAKDVKMYMTSPRGKLDNEVQAYTERSNIRHLDIDEAENTKAQATQYAKNKVGGNFNLDTSFDNLKRAAAGKQDFGADTDYSQALNKKNYVLRAKDGSKQLLNLTPAQIFKMAAAGTLSSTRSGGGTDVVINGKKYIVADDKYTGAFVDETPRFQNIVDLTNSKYVDKRVKDFAKYTQEYLGDKKTDLRKGFTFKDDSDYIKATKNKLTSLTGVEPTKITEVGYSPGSDRTKIMFSIQGSKSEPVTEDSMKAIADKLTGKGFQAKANPQTGQIEITNTTLDPQLDPFTQLSPYTRKLISTLENKIGKAGTKYQSTFYNLNARGQKSAYRIDKRFGVEGDSYYLYPSGSNTPISQKFNNAFEAYKFSEQMALDPEAAAIIK